MTENERILERIRKYQEEPVFHELTCGEDSSHAFLKGVEREESIVLICPDCEYVQDWVPDMFYHEDFDKAYEEQLLIVKKYSNR